MSRTDMKKCAIGGCTNIEEGDNPKFFYTSPRSFATRGLWMMAVGKVYAPTSNFYVCEDHFDMSKDVDYIHHITQKPVLLKGTVPTLQLEGNSSRSGSHQKSVAKVPSSAGGPVEGEQLDVEIQFEGVGTESSAGTEFVIQSKTDSNKLPYFRPLKRKVIDMSSTPESSVEKSSEVSRKDADFEMSQSDVEYESEDSCSSSEDEEEDSRLLNSDVDCDDEEIADSEESRTMCRLTMKLMEKDIQHYTGIPEASHYVIDLIEKCGVKRRDVLLVLRKIRHNETFQILGDSFGISRTQAGCVFRKSLPIIATHLKSVVYWPGATLIKRNLPLQFKAKYRNVQAIIDCFEISVAKPSTPLDQALTYSLYKHSNTIKYLIASTPDGVIIFISKGFAGRISDNEIVKRSGFLEFIRKNTEILADRSFKEVAPDIMSKGGILIKPPSTQAGMVFTAEEAKHCKTVAAIRIHIERVIGKIRNFVFLKPQNSFLSRKRSYLLEHAITVACGICNMQGSLTKI